MFFFQISVRMDAKSVHDQLVLHDLLINSRINLQKLLVTSNKLPQHDTHESFFENSKELQKLRQKALGQHQALLEALNKLKDSLAPDNQESQDVITLANSVMDEWYKKTNFNTKSNQVGDDTSIIKSIEQILSNRERLIRKTQTKRSEYDIIGKEESNKDDEESEDCIDPEIFDDSDFYRQLLHQLIESKTPTDSLDPVALSRRWLEVQKLRSKMKKKIDTKASKGRRIRYQVHNPLISFMAPVDNCSYEEETKDALFSSLFAKSL